MTWQWKDVLTTFEIRVKDLYGYLAIHTDQSRVFWCSCEFDRHRSQKLIKVSIVQSAGLASDIWALLEFTKAYMWPKYWINYLCLITNDIQLMIDAFILDGLTLYDMQQESNIMDRIHDIKLCVQLYRNEIDL